METKSVFLGIIIGLIIGGGVGYGVGYPQIQSLQNQITSLKSETEKIPLLQQKIENLTYDKSNLQKEIETLNNRIKELLNDIVTFQSQIRDKDNQISSLQLQIRDKDDQISRLAKQVQELQMLTPQYKKGNWNLVTTFTGKGSMTTQYFHIPTTEIAIAWTYTYTSRFPFFGFSLYREGQGYASYILTPETTSGTTYLHNVKVGYHYIDINAANLDFWEIKVYIWIPE